MAHVNRKATDAEIDHAREVILEAYPELEPVFETPSARVAGSSENAVAFRLRDAQGKFRCNVVWVEPKEIERLTPDNVRKRVRQSLGL